MKTKVSRQHTSQRYGRIRKSKPVLLNRDPLDCKTRSTGIRKNDFFHENNIFEQIMNSPHNIIET